MVSSLCHIRTLLQRLGIFQLNAQRRINLLNSLNSFIAHSFVRYAIFLYFDPNSLSQLLAGVTEMLFNHTWVAVYTFSKTLLQKLDIFSPMLSAG